MKIYLIGLPAVGKTYVGKILAQETNLTFIDLDNTIELGHKQKIEQIFSTYKEKGFRIIESNELNKIIDNNDSYIVSTGGGTPCYHNNIDKLLSSGLVIWLQSTIEAIIENIKKDLDKKIRPMFNNMNTDNIRKKLIGLQKERIKYYNKAHILHNIDNQSIDTLINGINQWRAKISSAIITK